MIRLATVLVLLPATVCSLAITNVVDAAIVSQQQTTIGAWGTTAIQDQDKIYTLLGTDFVPAVPVTFSTDALNPTTDIHSVKLFNDGNYLYAGNYRLEYSIQIDPSDPTAVNRYLSRVALGVDGSDLAGIFGSATVTKSIYGSANELLLTLTSSGGSAASGEIAPSKFIRVVEQFTLTGDARITSSTNSYRQSSLPEPASLVVWGGLAGLVGLVGARRRRRSTVA